MKILFYPALFHILDDGSFKVSFPDIPECVAQGDDLAQAYEMAVEALGLALTICERQHRALPVGSDPRTLAPERDAFSVVIAFDLSAYRKRTNSRAIKKTLSIPQWMNEAAMAMNINFSQVLQEALLAKIQS